MTNKTDHEQQLPAAGKLGQDAPGVPQATLAQLPPGAIGNRDVYHSFGAAKVLDEALTGGKNAQRAREYVNEHRDLIKHTAKSYGLDPLTLGNVIYQEMRHRDGMDDEQDKHPRKHPTATFGAGQVNVSDFKALVDRGILKLTPEEKAQYNHKSLMIRDGFPFQFLTDERCIRATAALITQRLNDFSNAGHITKNLGKDYDESTVALGQFIYGAGLYPKGGKSGDANFDKNGPTSRQIDFNAETNKTLSGLASSNIPHKDKIITAFHYLPETFEALYMLPAPHRLGGYFNERSVLRKASADAPEDGGVQVAAAQPAGAPRSDARAVDAPATATAAAAFGDNGQPGHVMFTAITPQVARLDAGLDAQQALNLSGALTARALETGLNPQQVNVTANDSGRVFAHDGNEAGRVAFVDRNIALAQPLEDSAARSREVLAAQAPPPAQDAPVASVSAVRMG